MELRASSRLLQIWLFFIGADIEELPQFLAGRFELLGLQAGLYNVERVRYEAGQTSRSASTDEVPEDGTVPVPRLEVGLQILIDTDNRRCEGDIHHHCNWVGPV